MLIPHSDIIRRRRGDRSPICVCPHRHQRMFIRQLSVHRPKPKRGSCVCVYYTDGQASVSILSCFFSNCTADDHGGTLRLYFGHTQTVSNCVFLSFGNDASYGGIIYCENQKTEVHVSHNFFSDGNGSFGGAVLLKRPKGPASISFCVFRNCHGSFGCSCHVDDTSNSVSISHCDFLECTGSYGGGLYFDDCSSLVTVTDSSFEKCNASTGGAIFINNTASFKLDSLQFASCTSNKGKDVCFFTQSKADVDGTDMIVNCTSSSGNNNVYFGGDNSNDSDLIPQAPAVSLTPISVSASLTLEGDEWVLTVSTSEPIEGTLLVVLDNKPAEESNYEQPTSRSPPPIGRLFVLDFGSGETSKSQSVPINEWSFLQYESNYSITVASLAGANITQSFSSILVTPNPSRIVEATCEIKDGDPTTGIISLRGRTLEEGHYMAQLKEVGDLPISVTFTESHTLPNSKTMISSTIEVSLLGEEMKLEYGKEYEVEFVRKDGADSFMLFDPPRLFMLVPDPTRLTGAGTGEYRNDKDPSIVSIPLTGTEIPIGSYEMNVSLVEDGSSEEITLNVTFSSKESGTATAVVFDAENGEVDLLFDSEYSIVSLWNEKGSVWIPSPLSFLVPSPPIVESVESATLDGNKSSLVVILFGSGLVRGPDTAILFDGSTEISSKNSISVPDSTHARVTFAAEWTTSPSTVAYGQSYSLKSVSSKYSKSFLVRPSVIVNVPKAPCVTEISCVINDSLTHFVVKFTGQNLPLSGTYTARLTIPFNFSVTFKDGVGTSGLIEGNGTNGLSFGRLYTLSNVSYGSDTIILNKTSFSTPAGPTLSDVMCSLDSSDFAFVDLTLTGSEMPSSTEYKLIIVEAGKYTQMIVPVSFNSQTDGKGRVEVYNKANTLKYGQSYSVNSLIFGSLSIYPSPSITFDVPNPPRLTAVDKPIVIHNDGQSTLSIALTGTEIPVGSYEMNVSLVEDGSSEEITLNVSFSSKESGTATAVVFDAENGKVDLLFDSEYSIVSLWNEKGSVWIPSHLSFFVPSNPGIVETVDSTSLNDAKMIVTLAFCGSDFVSGPTHIVLLDGSNEVTSFGNMSVISSTRFTVSVAAGWTQSPSTVAYGQTYSLKSVSSSSSSFLVQPSISVKIPKAPCVTEINCDIDTSLTHFVVKFTGQDLPLSGTYTARLMSSSTSFEVTLSERVGKNGLIEGNATNGLLFGTEYTLSSLSQGTDQILLNATSFSTPTGPTLSDVTCSLDSSDFNFVDLTLSGSGMPSSTEYKLIVADSEDSTQLALDVSFTSSSEGSGSVEVYHKEHTLKYGLTYSVVSLTLHSLSISLPSQSITFDVPNPPRLTAVDEPILVHNDGQSTISIALTGTEIPIGSYEMNVSLVEDGSSEEITLNVSFSSKESGTATAVVFDAENGKVDLLFDSEYSIDSLWKIDASIWIPSSLSFVVPSSPGIVESIDSALLNDAKTIVTLTFYGSDFVSGPTHVVLLDGSNEVMSNEDLYVRNEIHFTVTFAAGWTQSPSTVAYDQTYSLKSVSSSSSSFIVRPSISVTIPKAPCVTRIECDIDTSLVHFVVKLSGSGLPRWGTCTARLAESLFSFSVTFTNEVGWSDPIEGNASNGLLFGTEYTLSSLSQGTDQILLNATSFSTPTGPTLSDVTCSLDSSDFNFVDLTLSGSGMPSSTEYKLIVADSEDSTQLALDVSFTSSSEGSGSVEVYHKEHTLKYGLTYSVVSLTLHSLSISLPSQSITFDVPNPPRLTAVDEPILVHNDGQSTLSIALTGTEIPVGSYEMNVSLVEDGSSEEITLNVSFSSKESGTATAVVFDAENGKVDLLFDSEYSIVSLWNEKGSVWIPSHLSFFVPSNPGIVETVDSTSLNDAKMIVTLAFCGSDFVSGPTHIVLLDGSNEVTSFGNMSVISSTRFTVSVAAGWTQSPSTVAYGQTYSLKSVSSSSSSFLVQPSISVKIPKAPCVTEINCDIDTSLTHFVVKFTGQDLPLSGTYTARLMSSSTSFEVTLSERVGKNGLIEGNATNGLLFGTEYTLSSLSQGTDQILLNATSFSTPTGPTLSDVTCSLDSSDFNFVDLTLSGSGMPSSTEYKLIVADSEDSTQLALDVSFTSSSEGSGSVEVYHKEHTLKYGLTYSVVSLTLHSLSISLPSQSITFDVPNPPRLTAVDEPILVHNDGQSTISIALTGTEIPIGSYEMNVSLVEDGSSEEITLNVSFSSKESGTATAVVFDAENGKVDLLFDSEYSIDSLWKNGSSIWIPSSLSFFVPSSPGIVESVDSASLNDEKTSFVLILCGSNFVSGPTHVVLFDGLSEVTSNTDLCVLSETHFTITFAAGWTQSQSTVAYGQSYSLKSVSSSSSSFLVRSSISVKIPKAPCVTGIICDIDACLTHFVVKFTGQDLPLSGTYTARLMSSSASFEVTFLEGVGTSDPIEVNATNGLSFLTSYTLSSVTSDTDHLLLNATSFLTPAGPTLSDVTCSLDSSDFNFVDLTLTGSGMPSSTEYELIVADSEDSTQLTLDVSFTTPSEGSGKVEVYHKENTLKYERSYSVVSLFLGSLSISIPDSVTFSTPSAPIRIEGATADLLDDGTTVMITLLGVKLGEGSWMITVPTTPPQTIPGQLGEDGVVTFALTADDSDASKLIFGLKYKIDTVTLNSTAVLVNDDVFFTVPRTALVSSGSFVFVNTLHTSCKLVLEGSHFPLLGEYNVTLEPAFWTVVSFSSESLGESSEIEIGGSEGLKYSQQFTISLIVRTDDANDVIKSDQSIVLKTGSQPASAVFLVDSSGSSSPFCGDLARPCSSMDVGLSILSKVGIVQCEMKIIEKATQNKQHVVDSGSVLSMSASSTISAELEIGSSAWMGSNSGLFVVSSARLEFHEIAVSVRRQEESFVLVFGDNSTLSMKNTSFSRISSVPNSRNYVDSSSSNVDSSDSPSSLCDWSTGLFLLSNCTTSIKLTEMTHLPQGAMNMKGGSVTIEAGIFHDNTPNDALFPSARRNIRCSENGKVEVGSLSSGDGSTDKHPHLWLSSSDCILSGEDVNINAPLFVPTLSSDSTSSWNKKKEQFEVTILGTMLIPCGLFLEVFELKDNSEGKSYPIDLAQQSFISFTETNMTFTIARSSLSELDGSAEWRGRLVYGSNEKTHNSFQMQRDSSGRFSQTVKENMKWWLPLVIVLSVTALFVIALLIFLIRRRRQKENAKTQQAAEANELDMDIEVLKMEDTSIATTDRVHASSFESPTRRESIATGQKETKRPPESEEGEEDTKKEERVMACGLDGKEVAVVNKYDTLFNRLHHPRAGLDVNKNVVRKQIVCTLKSIVESGRFEFVLQQLSPHEIFFDGAGVVAVSLKQHPQPERGDEKEAWKRHLIQEQEVQVEHASNYQEMVEQNENNEEGGLKEGGMGKKSERVVIEGDRWKAPEVVMGKKGINSESAAVFSLGLILWELETHQVPFRELDALNAHLQLKTGQPLPMEGIESAELVEMITQCLDLDPANRPTLSELEKFLDAPSLHKPSQPLALNPVALVETFKSD